MMSRSRRAGHRANERPMNWMGIRNSRRARPKARQADVAEQGGRAARRYQTRGVVADTQTLSVRGMRGQAAAHSLPMRGSSAVARSTRGGDDAA